MFDEYIRRSDALKGVELFQCGWAEIEAVQSDYIERLPAADVAPVRHGRWIKDEFFSDEVNNGEKCSQCGELIGWFGKSAEILPRMRRSDGWRELKCLTNIS